MPEDHHVVVVGGGFGGIACVKALKRAGVRITLIDKRNHHLFQPLLYQVATTILPTSDVAWPIRKMMTTRPDVTTLMAEVVGVDTGNKRLDLSDGTQLGYDTLVLATGATHSYFGNEGWAKYAPGLKTLEDATTIRRRILSAFEAAEQGADPVKQDALQTYVIIGAGPTGVELAGIIGDLAHRVLPDEFRQIDTRQTKIILIEAGPRVLAAFPEKLSAYATKALNRLGVEVRTETRVANCAEDGVTLADGQHIAAKTTLWAAGVRGSDAGTWLRADQDSAGRVIVAPDLSAPQHADVFVIGDTAQVTAQDGIVVPGIAPAAKQMGQYVAKVLRARLNGQPAPGPFRYKHAGNLATIGPNAAVADMGWARLRGRLAWWVWGLAHIYFLIDTRSRIAVALSWFWSYMTGLNSARLITQKPPSEP